MSQELSHAKGRHCAVNGRQLWIEEEGTGDDVLLLLSGLGPAGSHTIFHPHFSILSQDFRLVYVDLYGRGNSERPANLKEVTFETDVSDVACLISQLGISPVNIYGFSYGGLLAQAIAIEKPELVKRLVLANTLHSPEMWQRNHENINHELEMQYPEIWEQICLLRSQGVKSTDERMQALFRVHSPLVRFYNPDNVHKLASDAVSRNVELYPVFVGDDIEFFIGAQVAQLPDMRYRMHEIGAPTLILAGRYDRALCPKYQLEFARRIPDARFVWMERSGSFSHVEEPQRVREELLKFLR